MRKLNITEDMEEDSSKTVEATHITSNHRNGKLVMLNKDYDNEYFHLSTFQFNYYHKNDYPLKFKNLAIRAKIALTVFFL